METPLHPTLRTLPQYQGRQFADPEIQSGLTCHPSSIRLAFPQLRVGLLSGTFHTWGRKHLAVESYSTTSSISRFYPLAASRTSLFSQLGQLNVSRHSQMSPGIGVGGKGELLRQETLLQNSSRWDRVSAQSPILRWDHPENILKTSCGTPLRNLGQYLLTG